jgi:DNA-directed RNA polymerase subunit D
MDVKILNKKDNELKLLVNGVNAEFMNAFRRACSFEVPVLAIENIYFTKNDSSLYDEILANRIGLIPFKTDLKSYNLPEKCTCKGKGCAKCRVKFTLKAQGPGMVLSGSLISKDPNIKPVFEDIPIVFLGEGQELEFEAEGFLGVGKEHVKWSPGLCFYQKYPKISITKNLKSPKIAVEHCPRNVFEIKSGKLTVKNLEACNLCLSCMDRTDKGVIVKGDDSKYIFALESWGQLSPEEIVKNGSGKVSEKLKTLKLR